MKTKKAAALRPQQLHPNETPCEGSELKKTATSKNYVQKKGVRRFFLLPLFPLAKPPFPAAAETEESPL
jgi:hypothetical protein